MIFAEDRLILVPSLFAAATLHGALVSAVLVDFQRPGVVERDTPAISLNLVETTVVASAMPEPAVTASTSVPAQAIEAPVETTAETIVPSGSPAERPAEGLSADDPAIESSTDPGRQPAESTAAARPRINGTKSGQASQQRLAATDTALVPQTAPSLSAPLPQRKPEGAPPRAELDRARRQQNTQGRKVREKPATKKGARSKAGTPSRAHSGQKPRQARLSASAGDVRNYAAQVRARIARNRPGRAKGPGTAVVSFALSKSGGLRYARLARSSGSKALDQAALHSVRRAAPFPPPPKAMTEKQLSFVIPFHFR